VQLLTFDLALLELLDDPGVLGKQRSGLPALALRGGRLAGGDLTGGGPFGGLLGRSLVLASSVCGQGLGLGVGAGVFERGVGGVLRAAAPERGREHPHGLLLRVVDRPRGSLVPVPVPVVVVVVGAGGVGGDVGVVAVPAAGHRDVQMLPVHPRADQHDPEVGGRALGGVDRGRPAVLGVLGQVGGGQHGPAAAGEVSHDQAVLRPGAQDLVAVTVADMAVPDDEPAVVASGPEHIPGLPLPAPNLGDRSGDLTGCERGRAGAQVQRVDVLAGPGQHQRVLPFGARGSPVREDAVEGGVTVGAGVQPPAEAVGGQRAGLACPQRQRRLAFPGLAEPVDLSQLHAVPGTGEGGEHPARPVDHPDLRGVPDQHDLRPCPRGRGDERVEVRVPAIDASSTITTVRSSKAVAPCAPVGSL